MMHLQRSWDRSARAPRQTEPEQGDGHSESSAEIDLERLVWDQEYRDEVRVHLAPAGPR